MTTALRTSTTLARPANATDCRCGGSGRYYSGGAVVNGKYTGRTGTCYGCEGKGYQLPADVARNRAYWRHNVARLAGF